MTKSDNTMRLLHYVSKHLSSRAKLRKVEYILVIDNQGRCYFKPPINIFPDKRRKKVYKLPLLSHVIATHTPDLFLGTLVGDKNIYGVPVVNLNLVQCGTYKYVLSFEKKSRRWVRIK